MFAYNVKDSVKKLSNTIYKHFGVNPVYIDLVSVELLEGQKYQVFWFGPNRKFLYDYNFWIDRYFNPIIGGGSDRISLLFLNNHDNEDYRFEEIINESNNCSKDEINFDLEPTQKVISLNFPGSEIGITDSWHIQLWKEQVIKSLNIKYCTFFKYNFSIENAEYATAIWIGFPRVLFEGELLKFLKDEYKMFVLTFLSQFSLNTIGLQKQSLLKQYATRAAISQIMARNMSHNIGSHVLSRMVTEKSIKDEIINCKLYDKSPTDSDESYYRFQYKPLNILNNNNLNSTELIAYFNSYLKSRMDFLGDIATNIPIMENAKLFFAEILSGFDKNRILLDRISGIENFEFEIVARDCRECTQSGVNKYRCENKLHFQCNCNNMKLLNDASHDITVSIPNDILGQHAFYVILENIIRNSAKHGNSDSKKLSLFIDFYENDLDKTLYELIIYDSNTISNEYIDKNKWHPDVLELLKENIDNKLTIIDHLITLQNIRLNKSIIDEKSNSLRQEGWGLIEMDASAAYLRKIEQQDIDSSEYEIDCSLNEASKLSYNTIDNNSLNILKAININGKLGYRMFLMKPKELLIIISDTELGKFKDKGNINSILQKLNNLGIRVLFTGKFENLHTIESIFIYDKFEIYSYPIMIFSGIYSDFVELMKNDSSLPFRKLISLDDKTKIINDRWIKNIGRIEIVHEIEKIINNPKKDFLVKVWCLWVTNCLNDFGHKIKYFLKDDKLKYKMNIFDDNDWLINFTHHGSGFDRLYESFLSNNTNLHLEPFGSIDLNKLGKSIRVEKRNENTGDIIDLSENLSFDEIYSLKLIDSCYTNICVIDERIQEAAYKYKYKPEGSSTTEIPFWKLFASSNVIIPEEKINLNLQSFKDIKEDLFKFIQKLSKHNSYLNYSRDKVDFFIIHLGILEKLIKTEDSWKYGFGKNGILQYVKKIFGVDENSRINEKISSRIIIVSGRGKPHNLPDEFNFLSYSILSQVCIENRLKFSLSEIVYSSKKIKS